MTSNRLVIVGAGAFGRELMCWASIAVGATWDHIAWVDDNKDALLGFDYPLSYAGALQSFEPTLNDLCVVAAGEPGTKRSIVTELQKKGARFATLIHPSAVIARTALIGQGGIFCPLSFVSADARVGNFVTVNGLSSVGHDVVLGDFCTLSAHVDLTGGVLVGEDAFFGTGAKVAPAVRIGKQARIGAGATIMRTVPERATMFAVPAKKL